MGFWSNLVDVRDGDIIPGINVREVLKKGAGVTASSTGLPGTSQAQNYDADLIDGYSDKSGVRTTDSALFGKTSTGQTSGGSTSAPTGDVNKVTPPPVVDEAAQQAAQAAARAQALANPLYRALSGLDTTLTNSKADNRGEFEKMMQEYSASKAADREAYDGQVSSNESGYAGQQQNKMLSGARLNRNLMSVLASMGALNGTGAFLGGEAVRNITNAGLGEAKDNFTVNSEGINTAWKDAEREQRQREIDAETLLKDKDSAAEADVLTKRQQILNQLASIFGADTAKGGQYLSEAGALYGDIAKTTRPNVGKYAAADSKYSAASLKDYLNGFGDTQIAARAANPGENVPINSPLYADTRRKDKQLV